MDKKEIKTVMKCIVGLGNPGLKYKHTRHNIGFDVIDYLVKQNGWKLKKGKFEAHYAVENWQGEKVLILKPQTFMNLSGNPSDRQWIFTRSILRTCLSFTTTWIFRRVKSVLDIQEAMVVTMV